MALLQNEAPILAFCGDTALKEQSLERLKKAIHTGWLGSEKHKAGPLACIVGSYTASVMKKSEMELGIPEPVAYLLEYFYYSLPKGLADLIAVRFIESIPVGLDWDETIPRYLIAVMDLLGQICTQPAFIEQRDELRKYWEETPWANRNKRYLRKKANQLAEMGQQYHSFGMPMFEGAHFALAYVAGLGFAKKGSNNELSSVVVNAVFCARHSGIYSKEAFTQVLAETFFSIVSNKPI